MFQDSLPITSLYFYIIQSRYFKYCPEDFISISCLPSNRSVFGNIDLFVFVFVLRKSDHLLSNTIFHCLFVLYGDISIYLHYLRLKTIPTIFSERLSSGEDNDQEKDIQKEKDKQTHTKTNTKCPKKLSTKTFTPNIFHRNKFPTCLLIA